MTATHAKPARLSLMRIASLAEATTLATLMLVAVPLKYMADMPQAVGLIGPLHGAAFLTYLAVLAVANASGGWRPRLVTAALVAAFIPLAGFVFERHLAGLSRR